MDRAVSAGDLKLHSPDESRPSPADSRSQTRSVAASAGARPASTRRISGLDATSRRSAVSRYRSGADDHRQTGSSVNSPSGCWCSTRRPMCPRACVSSSRTDGGVGSLRHLLRWLGQLRLEQLRLDHAAGCRVRAPQLAGDSPQAGDRERGDTTLVGTHESLVFPLRLSWTIDHRFGLLFELSR